MEAREKFARERRDVVCAAFDPDAREPAGLPERHDAGDVLGAGAASVFLPGAHDERRKLEAAPHVERANSLGRVELVAGDREQIEPERHDIDRSLADRLRGVGMHERALRMGRARDLGERL